MRQTNAAITEEKNKAQNEPLYLYEIEDFDGQGNSLHYAGHDENVVFQDTTYIRFPIKHDVISESSSGIDKVQVSISNVSRLMQAYLEEYNFRGKAVKIKQVFKNKLDDPNGFLEDRFVIEEYLLTETEAVFLLTSKLDLLQLSLPLRMYSRTHCRWAFKGQECGYSGLETACSRTKQRCQALGNFKRFGGFPSLKTGRTVIR